MKRSISSVSSAVLSLILAFEWVKVFAMAMPAEIADAVLKIAEPK